MSRIAIACGVVLALLAPGAALAQNENPGPRAMAWGDLVPSGTLFGRTIPFDADGTVKVNEDLGWIRTRVADFTAYRLTFSLRAGKATSQVLLGIGETESPAIEPVVAIPLLKRAVPKVRSRGADHDDGLFYADAFLVDPASRLRRDDEWQTFELRKWPQGGTELLLNGELVMTMSVGCCFPGWIGFKVAGEPVALRELVTTRIIGNESGGPLPGEPPYTLPVPTRQPTPRYTPEAMGRRITGRVTLVGLVDDKGTLQAAHVVKSLDAVHGLDREALRAVRGWRFKPARIDGRVVPVVVTIEMSFSLGKR